MTLRTSTQQATLDRYATVRDNERRYFAAQRARRQRLQAALVVAGLLVITIVVLMQGRAA